MTGSRAARALLMLAFAFSMILPVGSFTHPTHDAVAWSGVSIDLEHPTYAAKEQIVECVLTVEGGPAGDSAGNYSYKAEIVGTNTTGSAVNPSTGTSETGVFVLNVTMPATAPQTIKIRINATSKDTSSSASITAEREFSMKVVDPVVILATVFNKGPVDAVNVTARFYADSELLESRIFDVSANSSKQLTYNWTFLSVKNGKHVITVTVDDPNNIAEFSDGNNVFSKTIYVGKQGNSVGAVLTIGIIIMSVLVALMYMSKPQARRKKS
jgi:subtilase family serine protease